MLTPFSPWKKKNKLYMPTQLKVLESFKILLWIACNWTNYLFYFISNIILGCFHCIYFRYISRNMPCSKLFTSNNQNSLWQFNIQLPYICIQTINTTNLYKIWEFYSWSTWINWNSLLLLILYFCHGFSL